MADLDLQTCEQRMVGSLLHDPKQLRQVLEIIKPEDLRDTRLRVVFRALGEIPGDSSALPFFEIKAVLEKRGELEHAGGIAFVASLTDDVRDGNRAKDYATRLLVLREEVGSSEWDPPTDFDGFTVPPFPIEALPGELRGYVEELTASYQAPIDIPALSALGTLHATIARKVEVQIGGTHREPLNLYLAPTAHSGERKRVIRELLAPLYDAEQKLRLSMQPEIEKAQIQKAVADERIKHLEKTAAREDDPAERQRLMNELESLQTQLPIVPTVPQLIADDTTPENLGRIMSKQNERMAVVSEEAGTLFAQAAGRYSNSGEADLDLWLKGYDGGATRVGRISREPVVLDHPAITAIVTPQPIVLEAFGKHPEFRGRGFVSRWLFALPSSLVGTRKYRNRPVSAYARDTYRTAILRLAELPVPDTDKIPNVRLSGDALDLWATYQDRVEEEQRDGERLCFIRDWASKLAGKVARIAAGFHMLKHRDQEAPWDTPISEETIAAAWALGEYFTEHALAAYALIGTDVGVNLARRILRWIRRNHLHQFSRRDCHQAHRDIGKPDLLDPALEILVARSFIRRVPSRHQEGKRGRPSSPVFEVNPLTHKSHNTQNTEDRPNCEYSEYSEGRTLL